ncbi:MAG: hypothetical protein HY791_35470 [Deltaproteobacteria bacterium]|nr:hypothetical protein [Deltaproteobacteria bacterium]
MRTVGFQSHVVLPASIGPQHLARTDSKKPTNTKDGLDLTPRTQALRSAQAYAETAGSKLGLEAKMSLFHGRFSADVDFRDPLFGHLTGPSVFGKLAIEHSGGAEIRYQAVREGDVKRMSSEEIARIDPQAAARHAQWNQVSLRWDADYVVGGRPIHNEVETTLSVDAEGKIRQQRDDYDWKRWMDQAVPFVPELIRHSRPFKALVNLALGVVTHFKGRAVE